MSVSQSERQCPRCRMSGEATLWVSRSDEPDASDGEICDRCLADFQSRTGLFGTRVLISRIWSRCGHDQMYLCRDCYDKTLGIVRSPLPRAEHTPGLPVDPEQSYPKATSQLGLFCGGGDQ